MLIMEGNMVYEIDEECIRRENPPEECGVKKEFDKHMWGMTKEKNSKKGADRSAR